MPGQAKWKYCCNCQDLQNWDWEPAVVCFREVRKRWPGPVEQRPRRKRRLERIRKRPRKSKPIPQRSHRTKQLQSISRTQRNLPSTWQRYCQTTVSRDDTSRNHTTQQKPPAPNTATQSPINPRKGGRLPRHSAPARRGRQQSTTRSQTHSGTKTHECPPAIPTSTRRIQRQSAMRARAIGSTRLAGRRCGL